MASGNSNKKNQRKYVKYEREHSNSLWHIGWAEYNKNEKSIIVDSASRFIVCPGAYGE